VIQKVLAFIVVALTFLVSEGKAAAFDEIQTSAQVFYRLDPEKRIVYVSYEIETVNLTSTSYVENFKFMPSGLRPEGIVAYQNGTKLDVLNVENSYYKIVLAKPAVGVGNKANFKLEFEDRSLYLGTTSSWSFSIPTPKSAQEYKDYNLNLIIPEKYLPNLFLSPKSNKEKAVEGDVVFSFEKEEVLGGPLRVFYGNSQDYSINLVWSLKNAGLAPAIKDIKLPPDTPNQIVYLRSIRPRPQAIFKDDLGNTIARFIVGPITQVDVESNFEISRLFDPVNQKNEITLPEPSEVLDDSIVALSRELKDYKDVLFFTSNRLEYGYGKSQTEPLELSELVKGYSSAFCLDYTNLFTAISQSAGIKTATAIGYIVPPGGSKYRLLGNDLHSWVVMEHDGQIIGIDPTRYDTGGGDLYKENTSLDQITFFLVEDTGSIDYSLLPLVSDVTTISQAAGLPEAEFVGSKGVVELFLKVMFSVVFFGLISIFFVYLLVKHHGKIQLSRRN